MGWQDREYAQDDYRGSQFGGGMARPAGGSWLAGLPSPTPAVKWIMIVNFAIFFLVLFTGRVESPIYHLILMNHDLVFKGGQIWRLFTYMYAHDPTSIFHVGFNMLGLYFLGIHLERAWGTRKFLIFYHVSGLIALTLFIILTFAGVLNPLVSLVGASGCVYAVLACCAVLYPQITLILFLFPVPIRVAVLIFFALSLFGTIGGGNAGGDACHLAGGAFGLFFGYYGHRVWHWLDTRDSRKKESQWRAQRAKAQQLQDQVDAILEKVKREGINSLSAREKKMLETATKQQNSADRYHRVG